MRRSSLVTAFTVVLVAAAAPMAVGSAAMAGALTASDDNATVCRATQKTVSEGLEVFVKDMEDVSAKARSGDLEGAQTTVRHAGTALVDVSKQLREDAKNADDATLKETVNDLATEFESLGKQLTDLTGLQNFDTAELDKLADKMGELCGVTPSPGAPPPSGGLPSPSVGG
jgi:peptidoglycan hydrolase CwlO-like protein